jgi:hypothetical protein
MAQQRERLNQITNPRFAANPPVKLNIDAKMLGLIIGILAVISAALELWGLITVFTFCGGLAVACGFPIVWLLGAIIGLVGSIVGAIGGFRMYQLNPEGKLWVIYGILLAFAGAVIGLIGNIIAYAGLLGYGFGAGAIVGFIVDVIIYFCIYYLVIISRYPGEPPLVSTGTGYGGYGGPGGTPPPPPPPGL